MTTHSCFCFCSATDTCLVSNGGCDKNADCSHESSNYAVKCTCKTGYVFAGNGSSAVCTGIEARSFTDRDTNHSYMPNSICLDACTIGNGGCDSNSICSHDEKTNGVVCTCKTGYTNTTPGSGATCTGKKICRASFFRGLVGRDHKQSFRAPFVDSCQVKNGGCDVNSVCSHENNTNAVVCTCKTGYTNTGSRSSVTCTGRVFHF